MLDLEMLSLFPLKVGKTESREVTIKGNNLRITLKGNGEFVEHAKIENLSTQEVPYDWNNIRKQNVQMAVNGVISKLKDL